MPFVARSTLEAKLDFVRLASAAGANVSAVCATFGIGRTCGHKLLSRWRSEGASGLEERSRRPVSSPRRSLPEVEAAVLALRAEHPVWGGRKIAHALRRRGVLLAASTVTGILRRHGVELGLSGGGAKPFIRFEHAAPNDLWQMDFKGDAALAGTPPRRDGDGGRAGRLHPLTVLDDHSRYAILLEACADQTGETVKTGLIKAFRRYGLPARMICDNGPPWGDGGRGEGFTWLGIWLIEHGVRLGHARPLHPQTLGKDERFHRTLKAEAMAEPFAGLAEAQKAFDGWRTLYNAERPHDGIGGAVPGDRYEPSTRRFSDTVQPCEYARDDHVLAVNANGYVTFNGRALGIGRAFKTKRIALRPTQTDGVLDAFFRHQKIKTIDLTDHDR